MLSEHMGGRYKDKIALSSKPVWDKERRHIGERERLKGNTDCIDRNSHMRILIDVSVICPFMYSLALS